MTTEVQGEVIRGELVVLREKRLADAQDDYRWRTEAELSQFDAARPLTMSFEQYLSLFREELRYPSPHRHSFAIEDQRGLHIGNVMYYNIDPVRQEAELGITIGEGDCWGKGYGTEAVRLVVEHLVAALEFRRVYLKTLEWNERARRCFRKAGFAEYGRITRGGHVFVLMEYRREWLRADV